MHLVIVESPTKAKTIARFLGKDYHVTSSQGHVRDLPKSKMGVDIAGGFQPEYTIPDRSKTTVNELKRLAKKAEHIYFATDEDREGEAISWHLVHLLEPRPEQIHRIVFHEITKDAILEALANPRKLDLNLVDAQQARRILDRLVGYELSPFLWQKIRYGLSAGRVQSVAVRLIVEREREILAFVPKEYWSVTGAFEGSDDLQLTAQLTQLSGEKVDKFSIITKAQADEAEKILQGQTWRIADVERKETKRSPLAPFTTSTLQQDANRRFGFTAKRTMIIAQQLYEGIDLGNGAEGLITYMRTDSQSLSEKFVNEAATTIKAMYGEAYTSGPRHYKTNKKGAQEAHEAVRPTEARRNPESIKDYLDTDQFKLYSLIWSRAVASQMTEQRSELTKIAVHNQDDRHMFRVSGSVVTFPGFSACYTSDTKDELLPKVEKNQTLSLAELKTKQHFTEPPARYNDATLVKVLEEHGIGRPSTYAPTISTIIDRGYVLRNDARRLAPTDTGFIVNDLLVKYFDKIVDYEFTATMEQSFDDIADGTKPWVPVIESFYTPFHKHLEETSKKVAKEDILPSRDLGVDEATGKNIYVKTGRYGSFIQLGEYDVEAPIEPAPESPTEAPKKGKRVKKPKKIKPKSVSLLPHMSLETVSREDALRLLELPKAIATTDAGSPIMLAIGRFGPYLSADEINITVPPELNPLDLTTEQAKELYQTKAAEKKELAKPLAELGDHPTTGKPIIVKNGRFGPYITDGELNASLGKKYTPETITIADAVDLLEKKKNAPKRKWGQKKAT